MRIVEYGLFMMARLLFPLLMGLTAIPAFAAEPGDPSALAIPPQVTKRAGELIVILGGKDADKRNEAYVELDKLGRQALPAIEAALKGKLDAELRTNLDRLRGPAMKEQFQAAYKLFLADKDNKYQHDFPGWTQLKAAAKDNKDSRKLMRDILSEKELLANLESTLTDSDSARIAISERWHYLGWTRARAQKLSISEIEFMTLLLAECIEPNELWSSIDYKEERFRKGIGGRGSLFSMYGFSSKLEKNFCNELSGIGKYGKTMKMLSEYWCLSRRTELGLGHADNMCKYFELSQDTREKCWLKAINLDGASAITICISLYHFAATGNIKHLPIIESQFQNKKPSDFYIRSPDIDVQVKDHALLYAVLLTNQKPKDYGFHYQLENEKPYKVPNQTKENSMEYVYSNYAFLSDKEGTTKEKRDAAFKKWDEWKKNNKNGGE